MNEGRACDALLWRAPRGADGCAESASAHGWARRRRSACGERRVQARSGACRFTPDLAL